MKYIKEISPKQKYEKLIQKAILEYFYNVLYKPIIDIIKETNKIDFNNSINDLIDAITKEKIYYKDGYFKGDFSAKISIELDKLGAIWDKYQKGYKINLAILPQSIVSAISNINTKRIILHQRISEHINTIDVDNTINHIDVAILYEEAIKDIDSEFNDIITIQPKLTQEDIAYIAEQYNNNLKLYIKNFTQEQIPEIREIVSKNFYSGYRVDKLKKAITERYGVSESKAKFLARQETQLLTSKYNILKAQDAGIEKYVWMTMKDGNVRHDHKILDGEIIDIDNPPVVDIKTGRRAHAGEDFHCLTGDSELQSFVLPEKFYRRRYSGKLSIFTMSSGKTLSITPNHPILSNKGWIAAGLLNNGDYLINISDKLILPVPNNPNNSISTFEQQFSFYNILFPIERVATTFQDFHSDVAIDNQVDVINIKSFLGNYIKPEINKFILQNIFSEANNFITRSQTFSNCGFFQQFPVYKFASKNIIRVLNEAFTLLFGGKEHSVEHRLASVSWLNFIFNKIFINQESTALILRRKTFNTSSREEKFYQLMFWEISCAVMRFFMHDNIVPCFDEIPTQDALIAFDNMSNFSNIFSVNIQKDSIVDIKVVNFNGHIYNIQNNKTWYTADSLIVKNCRCWKKFVVE